MPRIEELKASTGFTVSSWDLYRSWRDAVKQQMTHLGISGKADAGRVKWAELTGWDLGKRPLSEKASLHGRSSEAGKKFSQAVDGLLVDVAKKLAHTRRRQVNLDPPLPPEAPKLSSNPLPPIYWHTELILQIEQTGNPLLDTHGPS